MSAIKSCAVFAFCWRVVKRVVSWVAICQLATTVLGGGLDKQPTAWFVEESTKAVFMVTTAPGKPTHCGLGVGPAGALCEGEAPPGGRRKYVPVASGPVPDRASPRKGGLLVGHSPSRVEPGAKPPAARGHPRAARLPPEPTRPLPAGALRGSRAPRPHERVCPGNPRPGARRTGRAVKSLEKLLQGQA